jgi:membrane associated rhomboid family serine protease
MADCVRCGRKLPAISFGKNVCSYCRQAEDDDVQPGGHVSRLVPAWRVGASVTTALIAVNVAVFLLMGLTGVSLTEPTGRQLVDWGADFGPYTFDGQPWRLLTSLFVHVGVLHILFNMYWVRQLGPDTVEIYGPARTVILYVAAGACGFFASSLAGEMLGGLRIPFLQTAGFTMGASASRPGPAPSR